MPNKIVTEKTCTKCGKTKPLDMFGAVAGAQRHKAFCKKCCSELAVEYHRRNPQKAYATHRRWAKAHPEHMRRLKRTGYHREHPNAVTFAEVIALKEAKALRTKKPCKRCGTVQPMDNFRPSKSTADGRTYQCRDCITERCRKWYRENAAGRVAKVREWQHRHPEAQKHLNQQRRALKRLVPGSHTIQEWLDLCARFENRCVCCGVRDKKLTKDHIIPISKLGSSHDISNIQPLCLSCNVSKWNSKSIDYRETPFINHGRLL